MRLHRHLLRHPSLLPRGAPLLLAVSGGQDSMALAALLADLVRLHHWRLTLWHGDHGWRAEAAAQAEALAGWAHQRGLPLQLERADPPPAGEAAARQWRYGRLRHQAALEGCGHVVTGHTASDRAETLLLNLARGCHQRGLASLGRCRVLPDLAAPGHQAAEVAAEVGGPSAPTAGDRTNAIAPARPRPRQGPERPTEPLLVRPLLLFSRGDTGTICRDLALPVQWDSSNHDLRFARNRLRAEVMPVLEELHPGAERRIAALAQRLEEDLQAQEELLRIALEGLGLGGDPPGRRLSRTGLAQLGSANRRRLLSLWLRQQGGPPLGGQGLEELACALAPERGPGQRLLAGGWLIQWNRSTVMLQLPAAVPYGHG